MKVVIINTSEHIGGAAVAAQRLVKALHRKGISVSMLVRDKQSSDKNVFSINTNVVVQFINLFRFYWERLVIFLFTCLRRKNLFRVSIANVGEDISYHPSVRNADIIHLHWINQGFLSLRDIHKLIKLGKPIVWTMHDMWPCTGICHHARDCDKYQKKCNSCFFLHSSCRNDFSSYVFKKKDLVYKNANIIFVGCSNWLTQRARKSKLLQDKTVISIPNTLDRQIFYHQDKKTARETLGLPMDKRLLLFGALNVTDERKGVYYLIEALKLIHVKNVELVVFGQIKEEIKNILPVPVHPIGYLSEEKKIALLYNAVDLFVTSSLEENLPNTIMESMACGTPCVGFDIGGIPEMIDHLQNGYVARYKDVEDLCHGIEWILDNDKYKDLSESCIKKVQSVYSEEVVTEKYISLYQELLDKTIDK